jgi:hypothetical protein
MALSTRIPPSPLAARLGLPQLLYHERIRLVVGTKSGAFGWLVQQQAPLAPPVLVLVDELPPQIQLKKLHRIVTPRQLN